MVARGSFISRTNGAFLALAMVGGAMAAAAGPLYGTLIGREDGDLLNYECKSIGEGRIECEFIQVLWRNKGTATGLAERLEQIPKMLSDIKEEDEKACVAASKIIQAALEEATTGHGSPLPPSEKDVIGDYSAVVEGLRRSGPEEIQNLKSMTKTFIDLCRNPSKETAEKYVRLVFEIDSRTCKPYFNEWSRIFKRVSEKVWTAESLPSGDCGIVDTSRFIGEEDGGSLWEYEARKVITNKSGNMLGLGCDQLDERPQMYTWRDGPKFVGCEFVD